MKIYITKISHLIIQYKTLDVSIEPVISYEPFFAPPRGMDRMDRPQAPARAEEAIAAAAATSIDR